MTGRVESLGLSVGVSRFTNRERRGVDSLAVFIAGRCLCRGRDFRRNSEFVSGVVETGDCRVRAAVA